MCQFSAYVPCVCGAPFLGTSSRLQMQEVATGERVFAFPEAKRNVVHVKWEPKWRMKDFRLNLHMLVMQDVVFGR